MGEQRLYGDRIGILGFSLGSRIASTVAGTDDRIVAFASWSGAVENGSDGWEYFFDTYYDEAQANGSVVVDLGWTVIELSAEWFDSMAASHALDDVAGYYGPLLAIAGEDDTSVDPIVSRELILNAGSLDATLRILPGADHIYHVLGPDQTLAEQVMLLTAEWFSDKLQSKTTNCEERSPERSSQRDISNAAALIGSGRPMTHDPTLLGDVIEGERGA